MKLFNFSFCISVAAIVFDAFIIIWDYKKGDYINMGLMCFFSGGLLALTIVHYSRYRQLKKLMKKNADKL